MTKQLIFLLLFLLLAASASAQLIPRSGTHFTFGIPEGPDNISDPFFTLDSSALLVTIISPYDGMGVITSPNGFCQEFTFISDSAKIVPIPRSLMHLNDIGKTNKGILLKTSQPVAVIFHDFLADAGEATQIYPDEALDTSYRVTSWGLFDDPGEDNHSQFVVTAVLDSTDVSIIPSVRTLGNHPAGIPIRITLNKGECYIVKSDISSSPVSTALSNSTVHSSKPVSIIAGVTCAYNPLGDESCNELLDELLPKKYTDTIFDVVPLRDVLVTNTVLFTSDIQNFFVFTSNGFTYQTTNGRIELSISSPERFTLTAPAQCFLLSEGSEVQEEGDPTIVSILPRGQYADTMIWFSPDFQGQIQFQQAPFLNYVSVIYPKAFENQVLLDGTPIALQSNPQTIVSSPMVGTVAPIPPGVHRLTSPVPIFATVSGFADADGYSFLPGTISPKLPIDTISAFLEITATPAKTCRTFDAAVIGSFHSQNDIKIVHLKLTYDPAILTLQSVNLGPAAQGGQWITDTRTPGIVLISASCLQAFTDSDAIAFLTFSTGPAVTTTTLTANLQEIGIEGANTVISALTQKNIDIQEIRDTLKASFSISAGTTLFGNIDTAIIRLTSIPSEPVNEIDLLVSYNHDLLFLQSATLKNTLIPGSSTITPTTVNPSTDEIRIVLAPPQVLTVPGIVARLLFTTFISDSTSGEISLQAMVGNTRPCPLDILSDQVSSEFTGTDTCSTGSLRALMLREPFVINSIVPNPSNGSFTINLDRHLFGEPLHISLIDQLGNEIWGLFSSSPDIHERIPCIAEHSIPNGTYFVRINGSGKTETQKIIIRN